MPRVLVTSDPPDPDAPVTLDETVEAIHVGDKHASEQLMQRIQWAVEDAARVEAAPGPDAQHGHA
jgi:hypothetical protein